MISIKKLLGGSLLALAVLAHSAQGADKPAPILFGDITWESGSLITEILRTIVEKGYGYPTDKLPGSTVSLEAALAKNDIQVIGEEWAGRSPAWVKAESEGKVFGLGDTVKGATEGWYVPEFVIKGDAARGIKPLAPDLKSVADLPKYKDVFKDPESPGQGRFLNSPSGWTSEIVNTQKLKAYKLTDSYVNFRTGSGAALDAEIGSSIRRGQPVLFYYWSPTPLMGRFKLIKLEEPPFNEAAWKTLSDASNPNPIGSASLAAHLAIGVSEPFHKQYPELVTFFQKVDLPIDQLNKTLGDMSEKRQQPEAVAKTFLKEHPEIWSKWVPADVAKKVSAGL
jgi:glycine betaine/proline transport system substrate-binding protein